MRALQNGAGILFISCLAILSVIAILGVWDFFTQDVIWKSFQTLGICALVAAVVMIAGRFMDASPDLSPGASGMIQMFKAIRYLTLSTLIAAVSLLALVGVLAIWDVITNTDVVYKSLSSIAIIAFSSYIAVAVCLERENHVLWQRRSSEFSVGGLIALGILFWIAVLSHLV
jgi:hypothetical protein